MKARNNPYRTEQILGIRYRFQNSCLEEFLARLQDLRYRGAIVGPEGTGKTTLLEDLQVPLARSGKRLIWFRLTREYPHFSPADLAQIHKGFHQDHVILFDGAELLGRLKFLWFRFLTRKAGGMIITTHQAGYLPTLLRTRTSARLLGSIMADLDPTAPPDQAETLYLKYRGNLREALREMYDLRALQIE